MQYPLHYVTYAPVKVGAATFNGLGEDTTSRNMTDGHTHRQTDEWTDRQLEGLMADRLLYKIKKPFNKLVRKLGYKYSESDKKTFKLRCFYLTKS